METQQPDSSSCRGAASGYKRASRKGAPRKFSCDFPGCNRAYSRAEHLQRHQLNHDPKEIFKCDVGGCDQKFVRADLLARHKKRHSTSYIPRNRAPSFTSAKTASPLASGATMLSPPSITESRTAYARVPHDAAILLTPGSSTHASQPLAVGGPSTRLPHNSSWPAISEISAAVHVAPQKSSYYHRNPQPLSEQPMAFTGVQFTPEDMARTGTENFAMWLFDPCNADFSVAQLPFLEGGLESTFNSNIHYDYESQSLTSSRSQLETPPQLVESDELLHETRRQEILDWLMRFRQRNLHSEQLATSLLRDTTGDFPGLNLDNMRDCVQEYWQYVSPRLPIVHQSTFNCNKGSIFLTMIMIALGAASLRGHDTTGQYSDCSTFAEVAIDSIRWDIAMQDDASPPVSLPVAQSLLLLELYEKMYSSRRFHERAHVYHTPTLTLLRRGSPLIGRCGTETPPEEHSAADNNQGMSVDARTQWIRWADTEAMQRVVFAAFMMDILHAAMFGHAADMAPHEIRLPLPCDDTLWTAQTPELARQHESNLRMYGIKTGLPFLDGLKKALHGKEVPTASFGRMIIMSGLLSVGWHLSHRETHLKSLDLTAPSTESQENWKQILLKAFDNWKDCFDAAQGSEGSPRFADQGSQRTGLNGPIQSAAVLYHLAHICLHVDIVDCQVYAGAKRVLGRKVSARDRANIVSRMETWAHLPSTRHAVLHAFKLLHRVLVDPRRSSASERERIKFEHHASPVSLPPIEAQTYSCRNEPDPHRPWIMYYAALCIWSYVIALRKTHHGHYDIHAHSGPVPSRHNVHQHPYSATAPTHWAARPPPLNYGRVVAYLSSVSSLPELKESAASTLAEGLPDLLDTLHSILSEAHSELLQEAHLRLRACRDILLSAPG
ncbi:hypothetical protein CONLIGDRAFT_587366 [Coniochaeta ligniaria NRRL 30616]|uniref:C2H2-type domain-containing protein n=1 Tax=Coniochaeta ligniaria NRRL 30616 TaxID=1408157 RepID=A0A1J7I535_9PEZI|nr:hypothetical protein CONLIGDRAFT_587366 [Coniochaeta ligniaria NRRL 30616]